MARLELAALKNFMVLKSDGSVDHDASHAKLTQALTEYEFRAADTSGMVARGVNAVFDEYKGQTLSLSSLVGYVVNHLKAEPTKFALIDSAVRDYVRSHSGGRGSLFGSKQGRGTWRWSDAKEDLQ